MPVFLSFTLLRLAKSRFKQILDPDVKEEGRSALFVATNLLKRMSLVNNDICAKSVDFFVDNVDGPNLLQDIGPF
jgi:hypothetical protein